MSTLVVGDDTDLLALLCYHARLDKFYVYFRPEPKKGKGISKNYDIKEIKETLGTDVCGFVLFVHAKLGCDTTSRLFGFGKAVALKKMRSNKAFQRSMEISFYQMVNLRTSWCSR